MITSVGKTRVLCCMLLLTLAYFDLFHICHAESEQNQVLVKPNEWLDNLNCKLNNSCEHKSPTDLDKKKNSYEWDIIVYSQTYANTLCWMWKKSNQPTHSCNMPPENNTWIVHGIWPTKLGTKEPSYCNSSLHYNETQLSPIMKLMVKRWTEVEQSTPQNFSLWQHEWDKHGTCATSLPALNNEFKYFHKGLKWHRDYNIKSVLKKGDVVPNSDIPTNHTAIYDALKKTLKINPVIECLYDAKAARNYLWEIRLCFNKSLELINCVSGEDGLTDYPLGNCPLSNPIYYPAFVPPV